MHAICTYIQTCKCTSLLTFNILTLVVPIIVSLSGPVRAAEVGSTQTIQCKASMVAGSRFDSITVSWIGPGGDSIINGNRITITNGFDGNSYTSSIQFAYLMEGDEGTYTCNVTSSSGVNEVKVDIDTLTSNIL